MNKNEKKVFEFLDKAPCGVIYPVKPENSEWVIPIIKEYIKKHNNVEFNSTYTKYRKLFDPWSKEYREQEMNRHYRLKK